MISNDMKTACIEKLTHIISVYGDQSVLGKISKEDVEKAMLKVADVKIKDKGMASFQVKYVLYNIENFRPEMKSEFERKVLQIWHEAYKTMDLTGTISGEEDIVAIEKESVVEEAEVAEEVAEEKESVVEEAEVAQEVVEEKEVVVKEVAIEKEPEKREYSGVYSVESGVLQSRRKRDWFDMLLDVSACLMQFLMRIKIRRK